MSYVQKTINLKPCQMAKLADLEGTIPDHIRRAIDAYLDTKKTTEERLSSLECRVARLEDEEGL